MGQNLAPQPSPAFLISLLEGFLCSVYVKLPPSSASPATPTWEMSWGRGSLSARVLNQTSLASPASTLPTTTPEPLEG